MKTLNIKLIILLVVGLGVTGTSVYFVHGFQVGRNASLLLRRADDAREQELFDEAVIHRQRYLMHNPDDSEQLSELAIDMKSLSESDSATVLTIRQAYAMLESALRQNESNRKLRRAAIEFEMRIGRYSDAVDHVEYLLRDDEKNSELQMILARCLIQTGEHNKAATLLESLLGFDPETGEFNAAQALNPNEVNAYVLLSSFYREQSLDPGNAEAVIRRGPTVNPQSHEAYLHRARYSQRFSTAENRLDEANQDIRRAIELAPDDADVIIAASEMAIGVPDYEQAGKHLQRGVSLHPTNIPMYLALSDLAQRQKDPPTAMKWVKEGLLKNQDNIRLLFRRADLELNQNDMAAARKTIEILNTTNIIPDWVEYLEGRISLMEQDWLAASHRIEQGRARMVAMNPALGPQIDLNLAVCYERLGKWDLALQAYQRLKSHPSAALAAQMGLARTYRALGKVDEAAARYAHLWETLQEAEVTIDPGLPVDLLKLRTAQQLKLAENERDWSQSDELLRKIVADDRIQPVGKARLGAELRLAKGEDQRARSLIEKACKRYPEDMGLWYFQLNLVAQQDGHEAAFAFLDELEERFGDRPNSRLVRAQLLVQQGGSDVKDALIALEGGGEDWTREDDLQLWAGLGNQFYRLRDFEQAKRLWTLAAEGRKADHQIRMRLFDLAQEMNDETAMSAARDEIEALLGQDSVLWQLSEIKRLTGLVRSGQSRPEYLVEARRLLEAIREKRPNWHVLSRTEAEIFLLDNDVESAVRMLERTLELGPENDPVVIRRLVQLLNGIDRTDDVEKYLARINTDQRTNLDAKMLIELSGRKGEFDVEELNRVVPEDSIVPTDLMWRSQMLAKHDSTEDAERSIQRAVEIVPRSPDVWLELVRFFLNAGKRTEARAAIRRAQLALPEKVAPLLLGRCHELAASTGATTVEDRRRHLQQAELFYRVAMDADPDRSRVQRMVAAFYILINRESNARIILDKMLADSIPYHPQIAPDTAWARRAKAELLNRSSSYQDYLTGVELIRHNVPRNGKIASIDLLAIARLSLTRPDPLSRQRAIRELEDAVAERKLTDDENLILAQLYERNNQWGDAEGVMGSLLANYPDRSQIVSLYTEMLLRQGEIDKAGRMLDRLAENSPLRPRIEALRKAKQGRGEEAVAQLLKLIPDPLPPEQHQLVFNIAMLLEEIKEYETAEKLLRFYISREPNRALVLASYLGRRKGLDRLDEAFQMCEQAIPSFRIESITQIGVASLRKHMIELEEAQKKDEYVRRVQQWFDNGIKQSPDSKALLLQIAEFEDLQGNVEKVIQVYQKYLSRTDIDRRQRAIVQNNLAYVLALEGQGEKSLELIEASIEELGPQSDLLDTRAMAHLSMGEHRKAIRDLHAALRSGDSPMTLFHLAFAQFRNQNQREAEDTLKEALRLGLVRSQFNQTEKKIFDEIANDQ